MGNHDSIFETRPRSNLYSERQTNRGETFFTGIVRLTEIPNPEELIPNGGLWYQVADIQLHTGAENEMNKSERHPAFEVSNLEVARQHLILYGIAVKKAKTCPTPSPFSVGQPPLIF